MLAPSRWSTLTGGTPHGKRRAAALPERNRRVTLRGNGQQGRRGPALPAPARRGESAMDFAYSERVEELRSRLLNFFDEHIIPNDRCTTSQHAERPTAGSRCRSSRS
jgi:hypothetical protein